MKKPKHILKYIVFSCLSLSFTQTLYAALESPAFDIPIQIKSESPYLLLTEYGSGLDLLSQNATVLMHPSSITKIMTVYLIMKKIKEGHITLETKFSVSKTAWKREGSSMFLSYGQEVSVKDLLYGIIIQSGNDASVVAAEGLFGSEEAFAAEMTNLARSIGATQTVFKNATGIPEEGHVTTAKDMIIITSALMNEFPEMYKVFTEKKFTYNKITQGNRNPLLYGNFGCDGGKTGYSSKGGYGIVASFKTDEGARFVLLVNGLKTAQKRANEVKKIITWAKQMFKAYPLFKKDAEIARVPVCYGDSSALPLTIQKDFSPVIPYSIRNNLSVKAFIPKILKAPIDKNTVVGCLHVTGQGIKTPYKVSLIAKEEIKGGGFLSHIRDSLYLLLGKSE